MTRVKAVQPGRNKGKLVALFVLLMALAALLGFTAYYLMVSEVASTDLSGAPKYQRSIYGSSGLGIIGAPMGVATDRSGNVYVIDTEKRRVLSYDSEGTLLASFPREKTKQQLVNPLYVAVSPKGEVFVSDRGQAKLLVFTAQGNFIREFKPKGDPDFIWSPVAVAFDSSGKLYVTDFSSQTLRIFARDGALIRTIGRAGELPGQFQFPNGIAVGKGKIYVSDSNNGRIQAFEGDGKFLFEVSTGSLPRGIALDGRERLFVVDTLDHHIRVHRASDGKFLFTFGGLGQGEGQFLFPNGIAFDGPTRMYISDRDNDRLTVWGYE